MKNKLLENIGLKILAVVLAIITWLVVMNIDDYSVTKTIVGIPVVQLNGDTIDAVGKVYDVTEGETVDIVVKGPRSKVTNLSADDFMATADLSKMSITNSVTISVVANSNEINRNISIKCVNDTMVLSIEDKVTAQLPITVVATGTAATGYYVGDSTATPNIVTIEGPKSVIERVNEIRATVDITNKFDSFETVVEPVCVDLYGESLMGKNISIDTTQVKVSVPIYKIKTVDVHIRTAGTIQSGYVVTNINYHPQQITIAGSEEAISELESIEVQDLSISGASESFEQNIMIEEYLPKGVYLADTNKQIAVNVTIEALVESTIAVVDGDVTLSNMNDEYDYNYSVPMGYFFKVSGLADNINSLTIADLQPTCDVSGLEEGKHMVVIDVVTSSNYSVTNTLAIEVEVVKKEAATDETDEADSQTADNEETGSTENSDNNSTEEAE